MPSRKLTFPQPKPTRNTAKPKAQVNQEAVAKLRKTLRQNHLPDAAAGLGPKK